MTMCAMLYSMTASNTVTHHINLSLVPSHVTNRVDFDCNNTLTGSHDTWSNVGRLPIEFVDAYFAARDKASDFYVVKSYATPIAWFANGEWTMPEVKYSPTTSRHQAQVKRGIHA